MCGQLFSKKFEASASKTFFFLDTVLTNRESDKKRRKKIQLPLEPVFRPSETGFFGNLENP